MNIKKLISALLIGFSFFFLCTCCIFWFNIKSESGEADNALGFIINNNKDANYILLKMNDQYAYQIYRSAGETEKDLANKNIDIIEYTKTKIPFCWICGNTKISEIIIISAAVKGDWLYSTFPSYISPDKKVYTALNIKSNELIYLASEKEMNEQGFLLNNVPKLSFDKLEKEKHKELYLEKDICVYMLTGFSIIIIILLLIYFLSSIKRKK